MFNFYFLFLLCNDILDRSYLIGFFYSSDLYIFSSWWNNQRCLFSKNESLIKSQKRLTFTDLFLFYDFKLFLPYCFFLFCYLSANAREPFVYLII